MQRVTFRKWKGSGDVIAVFPDQRNERNGFVMAYEHVGQHGEAVYPHSQTLPAKPNEYAPLLAELKQIGYDDLRVVKRVSR
jgi:hypothetical protein